MTAVSGWKDYITNDELLEALSSYINDKAKRNQDLKITDTIDAWENGEHEFLLVKPETMEAIGSQPVVEKAKGLLGLN
jgi:glutamate synthase domain-containing protein 3